MTGKKVRKVNDYPAILVPQNHIEPVPRRIRGVFGSQTILDTSGAKYVWESPYYPQYYVPLGDVRPGVLVDEGQTQHSPRGLVSLHGLRLGDLDRPHAAKVLKKSTIIDLDDTVRFEWSALDAWFEEDELVHVHARSPYVRVDALHSTRSVRIELNGQVVAQTSSPVMVFETGLPTRYYINRAEVDMALLIPSETVTQCPYKGTTSRYWSVRVGEEIHRDLAWEYDFPTLQLQPIAGMIAFYNEKVDIFLEGERLTRPETHFSH